MEADLVTGVDLQACIQVSISPWQHRNSGFYSLMCLLLPLEQLLFFISPSPLEVNELFFMAPDLSLAM